MFDITVRACGDNDIMDPNIEYHLNGMERPQEVPQDEPQE